MKEKIDEIKKQKIQLLAEETSLADFKNKTEEELADMDARMRDLKGKIEAEKTKKFGYFENGDKTNFAENDPNIFSYNPANGEVNILNEGWEYAKTNLSLYIDKVFNRLITGDDLNIPFDDLDITPAIIDKNGNIITKGKIEINKEKKEADELKQKENTALEKKDMEEAKEIEAEIDTKIIKRGKNPKTLGIGKGEPVVLNENDEIVKKINQELKKIKTNDKKIKQFAVSFEAEGYSKEDALRRAQLEENIACCNKEETLFTEYFKLKKPEGIANANEKLKTTRIMKRKSEKELGEIIKKYPDTKTKDVVVTATPDVVTPAWTEEEEKKLGEHLLAIETLKNSIQEIDEKIEKIGPFIFSPKLIENKIKEILGSVGEIKNVEELLISSSENEFTLSAKVKAKSFGPIAIKISLEGAHIVNDGNSIKIADNYSITANLFEGKVKKMMAKNISQIGEKIKEFIEKEKGVKIEKIWIENGELKALPEKTVTETKEELEKQKNEQAQLIDINTKNAEEMTAKKDSILLATTPDSSKTTTGANPDAITPGNAIDAPENPSMLTPEQIQKIEDVLVNREQKARETRDLELKKGPARIKSGVINSIEKWDNLGKDANGKNEKGPKAFGQRMFKASVNLALIGLVTITSVQKLSEAGIGTASALATQGATTYFAKRMVVGLLMAAVFDKLPDRAKKWAPYVIGGGFVALSLSGGAFLAAGLSAASLGVGYISSTYVKGSFTKEKIIEKEKNAQEKLVNKFKEQSEELTEEKLTQFEEESKKIIKKYENQRIWGRVLDGAKKLTVGSAIAGVMLEASGMIQDHHAKVEMQEKIAEMKATHVVSARHLEKLNNEHLKNEAALKTEHAQQNTVVESKGDGVQEFMKTNSTQEAIKLGMYNPGNPNESMTVQSGTLTFDDGHGNHVEVPYNSHGAIQTVADLKEAMSTKFGGTEHVPHGTISTHYVDMKGTTHDQTLIGTNGAVVEKYNGDMFDSDKNHTVGHETANQNTTDDFANQKVVNIDGEALKIEGAHTTTNLDNSTDSFSNQPIIKIDDEALKTQPPQSETPVIAGAIANKDVSINHDLKTTHPTNTEHPVPTHSTAHTEIHPTVNSLSIEGKHVYENMLHKMFPDQKSLSLWDKIKDSTGGQSAEKILHRPLHETTEELRPLIREMNRLHEITGLEPRQGNILLPDESPNEFILRNVADIEQMGKLKKID